MGEKAVPIRPVEAAAIRRIAEAASEQGLSGRGLAELSGLGRSRCQTILNGDVTCSLSDFVDLCRALGLVPSAVVREAEEAVRSAATVVPLRRTTTPRAITATTTQAPDLTRVAARRREDHE